MTGRLEDQPKGVQDVVAAARHEPCTGMVSGEQATEPCPACGHPYMGHTTDGVCAFCVWAREHPTTGTRVAMLETQNNDIVEAIERHSQMLETLTAQLSAVSTPVGFFTGLEVRFDAFAHQLVEDGTAIGRLTAHNELLHAHSENLIGRMFGLEKLAGLHDPCRNCSVAVDNTGSGLMESPGCSKCNGTGCNPIPKWDRLSGQAHPDDLDRRINALDRRVNVLARVAARDETTE
jgi:hypothetical protein